MYTHTMGMCVPVRVDVMCVCKCVHACIPVHMYTWTGNTRVSMCVYLCVCVRMSVCIYLCAQACVRVSVCMCTLM